MKLNKIQQLMPLMNNLMESYNVFTNLEALERKAEAWFEQLEGQNIELIKHVMKNWNSSKFPIASDILKKCHEISSKNNVYTPNNFICEYHKFSNLDQEDSMSKSLCENNNHEKKEFNFGKVDLNGEVFMVCYFHKRKLQATFENNPYAKMFIDELMLQRKNYGYDLDHEIKKLSHKLTGNYQ